MAGTPFKKSVNVHDWLGPGVYFWESNPARAFSFAEEQIKRGNYKKPFVVGAVLSLGRCVDTLSEDSISAIRKAHQTLIENLAKIGKSPPNNHGGSDLLLRDLDCAVINTLHELAKQDGAEIDSVRGLYHEGGPLYDNSGFFKKSHVQIAICNLDCIKGVFRVPKSLYGSASKSGASAPARGRRARK